MKADNLKFNEFFQVFAYMFSKSSAENVLYMGKGLYKYIDFLFRP